LQDQQKNREPFCQTVDKYAKEKVAGLTKGRTVIKQLGFGHESGQEHFWPQEFEGIKIFQR